VSVRVDICPNRPAPHSAAAGLLLWARRAQYIDRLLPGAQQHGAQQQMRAGHVVS